MDVFVFYRCGLVDEYNMPINGSNASSFNLAFNAFRLDDRVHFVIVKWF